MKNFALATLILVTACTELPPEPLVETNTVIHSSVADVIQTATRAISFRAQTNETDVVANCQLNGPGIDVSFDTPAQINIPISEDSIALITDLKCSSGGIDRTLGGIPGADTSIVVAEFGASI